MRILSCISLVLGTFGIAGSAAGDTLARYLVPDVIEGTLAAAECIGAHDRTPVCSQRALSSGQPGGVLDRHRFTTLLIDGRVLARTCAARTGGRLRASGVLHGNGFAMSVFRIEQDCGQGWTTIDLPHAGTVVDGAAGGDE